MLAQVIINEVEQTLQDPANIRWSLSELLSHLSEAQRVIVKNKPNAYSLTTDKALTTGTRQTLPTDAVALLDVIRNSDAKGSRVIRQTSREDLDGVNPWWHATTAEVTVTQFTYDDYDPLAFYVYPPNDGTGSVVILYSALPPDVDDPLDTMSIPDFYRAPLVDYVLYRAYQKDSEDASNQSLASMFFNQFMQGMSIMAATEQTHPPAVG